nr:MAG TPA: hypothetical protein [Caudoviricetes sp.]
MRKTHVYICSYEIYNIGCIQLNCGILLIDNISHLTSYD